MRARLLAMLRHRTRPSPALGVLVGVLCIVAETVIAALLRPVFSAQALTVVYLPGIVVVASAWGLGLGLAMALASAFAFYFFFIPPTLTLWFTNAGDLAVTGVFLVVALLAGAFSGLAWSLAVEVEARTEENFAAELARLLLRSPGLEEAVPIAAQKLAQTLELPSASIEFGSIPPDEGHEAFPLGGDRTVATLLVPVGLPRAKMRRVRERVVPSLEVLVQAAQERERAADVVRASRDELRLVVDEQTALRRLATLVAHGVAPDQVLAAIAREMGQTLGAGHTQLNRYETDGTVTCVGVWNRGDVQATMPLGERWPLEKGTVSELVARTRAPGRIDAYEGAGETLARFRARGIRSAVGCPIMVGRSLWGVAVVNSSTSEPLPPGTEERIREFTDLATAAIANAQSNADLKASRARIVVAADETRRRIERDLHDGVQQRLVTIGLKARAIEAEVPPGMGRLKEELSRLALATEGTLADLQEISRGLHPPILAKAGLSKALATLANRSSVTVELKVSLDRRLPERLEVTVYYIVSEALTNAAKHAHASVVRVTLAETDRLIRLSIRDDGVGGASRTGGSGLIGLTDRIETLGGTLTINSPPGRGTSLLAEIPIEDDG